MYQAPFGFLAGLPLGVQSSRPHHDAGGGFFSVNAVGRPKKTGFAHLSALREMNV
jgi:hypothetical protein